MAEHTPLHLGAVYGGRVVTPDGRRYWWPTDADTVEDALLADGWTDIGYVSEDR